MKKWITFYSLLFMFIPYCSIAHPGHGETGGFTITHYTVEPVHAFVWITMLFLTIVTVREFRKKNKPNYTK